MYNRYIGNTGKRYIIEENERSPSDSSGYKKSGRSAAAAPGLSSHFASLPAARRGFSLSSILHETKEGGSLTGALRGALSGILPKGIDIGDLLLILILLLIYLEKEDEDILIMLSALIYLGLK
ncbi:MAG: hypothetical protein GXY20_00555 [Clostridiales bacterium]|nr:hypothetical protein [Clostridiales bacterium]